MNLHTSLVGFSSLAVKSLAWYLHFQMGNLPLFLLAFYCLVQFSSTLLFYFETIPLKKDESSCNGNLERIAMLGFFSTVEDMYDENKT